MVLLQIASGLKLESITDRSWNIQGCVATKGEGIQVGMRVECVVFSPVLTFPKLSWPVLV